MLNTSVDAGGFGERHCVLQLSASVFFVAVSFECEVAALVFLGLAVGGARFLV
jgi:hypothetical protein